MTMTMTKRMGLALLLLVLAAAPARAAEPLTLGEVLASSRQHAPQVMEAVARTRSAQGRALTAEGAFDTLVSGEVRAKGGGPYDGRLIETSLSRPIADWGGTLYTGYRLSGGAFPTYEGGLVTDPLGEIKVGALFSLLRDRAIDDRRFNRSNAKLDVRVAELERLLVSVSVQRRALSAYNVWVAAGLRLRVYRDLLSIAQTRQTALQRQVELGARPSILVTESEQAILRRQALVTRGEQDLANAATNLSFFLRDSEGRPVKPSAERLPEGFVAVDLDPSTETPKAGRPDLGLLDARIAQAGRRLELERNSRLPRLDLRLEASQDLGGDLPNMLAPRNTELTVGLRFSLPLQQRAATGRIATAEAEIEAVRRRRQALEDQINVDLQRFTNDVRATAELHRLADEERARAATMAAAERRRFEIGASDFFLVNVREETAADADVRRIEAAYRQIDARAELAAAAMDLPALGLDASQPL